MALAAAEADRPGEGITSDCLVMVFRRARLFTHTTGHQWTVCSSNTAMLQVLLLPTAQVGHLNRARFRLAGAQTLTMSMKMRGRSRLRVRVAIGEVNLKGMWEVHYLDQMILLRRNEGGRR